MKVAEGIAWPDWLDEAFTEKGRRELERVYEVAKSGRTPRATRISAEDLATATLAAWRVAYRPDLIREGRWWE